MNGETILKLVEEDKLKLMGDGSTRKVYKLNDKYVAKIDRYDSDHNQLEYNIYTQLKDKLPLTKVYKYCSVTKVEICERVEEFGRIALKFIVENNLIVKLNKFLELYGEESIEDLDLQIISGFDELEKHFKIKEYIRKFDKYESELDLEEALVGFNTGVRDGELVCLDYSRAVHGSKLEKKLRGVI
ncbi:MAG: hypothetical protein ACRC28_18640 [Clostridium sp.]|uniref:hypothetical protein n=1 Tax=Clostridium sp. TaxID=1506 RepID=UPI003F3E49AE